MVEISEEVGLRHALDWIIAWLSDLTDEGIEHEGRS
jgi:hypothetical protein